MSRLDAMRQSLRHGQVIQELRRTIRRRVPLSRRLARWLSILFALLGAVPLILFGLARTSYAQAWAARTVRQIVYSQLGLKATFSSSLQTVPFAIVVSNLVVPSSTPQTPDALRVARLSFQPSFFSLLRGEFVVRDIVADDANVHVVFRHGKLVNVPLSTHPQKKTSRSKQAAFRVISLNNAQLHIVIDDQHVVVRGMDVDLSAQDNGAFEVLSRVSDIHTVLKSHLDPDTGQHPKDRVRVFEDVFCDLDMQARFEPGHLLVRRFRVTGRADTDPAQGSTVACGGSAKSPQTLALNAHMVSVRLDHGSPVAISGDARVRGPVSLVRRWVPFEPLAGWVDVSAHGRWARGEKLPTATAVVRGGGLRLGGFRLAKFLEANALVSPNKGVVIPNAKVGFADATVGIEDASFGVLDPSVPIKARKVSIDKLRFPGLMRDLDVTEHTHVRLDLPTATISNVRGTLAPLHIDSRLLANVRHFEVFDDAFDSPTRAHVIGVPRATIQVGFAVRPNAIEFQDGLVQFGGTSLRVFTSLGFDNKFGLRVMPGSRIDLSDVSPLSAIEWKGKSEISASITGTFSNPTIRGKLGIKGFSFGGMAFGDILTAEALFRPLSLQLSNVQARKGSSRYAVPKMLIDFNGPASVATSGEVRSTRFAVDDFLKIFHLDKDPRYADLHGAIQAKASLRYELGGPHDRCDSGSLHVRAQGTAPSLQVAGEDFQGGRFEFDLDWFDMAANELGLTMDLRSFFAKKGTGTVVGQARVRPGGVLTASATATDVPLSAMQSLGVVGKTIRARGSVVANITGTLSRPQADMDIRLSPARLGSSRLGPSRLHVRLTPADRPVHVIGRTACGLPITRGFDRMAYDKDPPNGLFELSGQLFGGQVLLEPMLVTWQRHEVVSGTVTFKDLQVGRWLSLLRLPGDDDGRAVTGKLSAQLQIGQFSRWSPERSDVSLAIQQFEASTDQGAARIVANPSPIILRHDTLTVPTLGVRIKPRQGPALGLDLYGDVSHVSRTPKLNLHASLLPADLSMISGMSSGIDRARGKLTGQLDMTGSLFQPKMHGWLRITDGALRFRALPTGVHNVQLLVRLQDDALVIEKATGSLGGGSLRLTGSMPFQNFAFGAASVRLEAQHVHLALAQGVDTRFNADLRASWTPGAHVDRRSSVHIGGNINLLSFAYTRPFALHTDLGMLATGGGRKKFDVYDPDGDFVQLNVLLTSSNPLILRNNLADMRLNVVDPGLSIEGSNQRLGMIGSLRVSSGSVLHVRNNEFEVKHGRIRFDDPTQIQPYIDLMAVTEYRRYAQTSAGTSAKGTTARAGAGGGTSSQHMGGNWRIQMHAHGNVDELGLDLSSEPSLSQEDIVLLLTMGVTRAEMDRMHASAFGESAALEALSALTGAGDTVEETVPVIDEFRFGSAYSARSGKSEPTITVGKRVTDRVRASVTTGLSDNQEVRSNIEWKFTNKTSILGSYDNVNNVSNSSLGNVGADIRFRLVFE